MKNKYFFHTILAFGFLLVPPSYAAAPDAETTAWLNEAVKAAKTFDYRTIETYPAGIAPYMGDADPENGKISGFDSYMKAFNIVYSPDQARENKSKSGFLSLSDIDMSPAASKWGPEYYEVKARVRFETYDDYATHPNSRAAKAGLITSGPRCRIYERSLFLVMRLNNGHRSIMQWIEGAEESEEKIPCEEAKALQLGGDDLLTSAAPAATEGE